MHLLAVFDVGEWGVRGGKESVGRCESRSNAARPRSAAGRGQSVSTRPASSPSRPDRPLFLHAPLPVASSPRPAGTHGSLADALSPSLPTPPGSAAPPPELMAGAQDTEMEAAAVECAAAAALDALMAGAAAAEEGGASAPIRLAPGIGFAAKGAPTAVAHEGSRAALFYGAAPPASWPGAGMDDEPGSAVCCAQFCHPS